jgi:DNA-binding response OmpR family regulator
MKLFAQSSPPSKPGKPAPRVSTAMAFAASKETDFGTMTALIIDDNDASRMTVSGVLRDIGIGRVKSVRGTRQAKEHLKEASYDVILCEFHFGGPETGQDLLDELRRNKLVPFNTIFFMVTGEAIYDRVAGVVENAPDDYLLKPFKPGTLEVRLNRALAKKVALLPIWKNLEEGAIDKALIRCKLMVRDKETFWLDAARMGAEICLHLNRQSEAEQFYKIVLEAKALPWAKLGIAEVAMTSNDTERARDSLEALVSESGAYVDAFDMLAKVYFEEGSMQRTLDTLRKAVEATPSNVVRLQKLGTLAVLMGEAEEAEASLSKAFRLRQGNRDFDPQTLVLLLLLALSRGEQPKDMERYVAPLSALLASNPTDKRLRNLKRTADICVAAASGDKVNAQKGLRDIEGRLLEPGFDFESAIHLLTLTDRLAPMGISPADIPAMAKALSRRLSVSKAAVELLVAATGGHKQLAEAIAKEHAEINLKINDVMSRVLDGDIDRAARGLAELAKATLNGRIVSLAENLTAKHAQKMNAQSLQMVQEVIDLAAKAGISAQGVQLARITDSRARRLPLETSGKTAAAPGSAAAAG